MNPYTATRLPDMPSLAEQIETAAKHAPRQNIGGASKAAKTLTPAERMQAVRMYEQGMPCREIAEHFGVSIDHVRRCVGAR